MINLRENIWAVEVPENAETFELLQGEVLISYDHELRQVATALLPPGAYDIICTSNEATEDDCAIIAGLSFQDVVHGYSRTFFHDLLTEKGCDLNKNNLILKKRQHEKAIRNFRLNEPG